MTISDDNIEEMALAPKKTVTDEGSVEERPISELIEAQKLLNANAVDSPLHGLRISRFKSAGPV